ncbi:hypothetical protein NUV25_35860, partial [Burkholderia pseudomultivorans]|uniref:hypothetical protein n=1 Tax=Burkholderia pseudomultivorans TaxID=1207504 RepID=UPI0028770BB9
GLPAALRFQQQRSEIMNRVSQVVNNFLLLSVATAGFFFLRRQGAPHCSTPSTPLPLPRRVAVSAKEA